MKLVPLAHPEDVRDLTSEQRRAVVQALRDLARGRGPEGKVLAPAAEHQKFKAPLAGLRSLAVHTSAITDFDDQLRIVYTVKRSEFIDVIAIGPRQGSAVYQLAAERLRPKRGQKPRRMRR